MRSLVIAVGVLLVATSAFAKPKVAIAPIKGDPNDQIGMVLVEVLGDRAKVVSPDAVEKAMAKIRVVGDLDSADIRKLKDKLGVSVVVQGRLKKEGKKRSLSLSITGKGKARKFTVKFKSAASDKFRENVRDELVKRIEEEAEEEVAKKDDGDGEERESRRKKDKEKEEGDERESRRKKDKEKEEGDERESRRKKDDEDARKKDDDERESRRKKDKEVAEESEGRKRKDREGEETEPRRKKDKEVAEGDGEGEVEVRKRKKKRRGDADGDAGESPHAAARLDAGATYGLRQLTWQTANPMGPPKVSTPAPSARFQGELYPLALADRRSPARGLGIMGEYDKSLGISIAVPNSGGKSAPINQAHYSIGAKYRLEVGAASAVSLGVSYAKRHTLADRSQLMDPNQLDTPDVNYSAVVPGVGVRVPVASSVALIANAAALVITNTGAIQKGNSYGFATVYGFEGDAGIDIALSKQFMLCIAGELSQINFKFRQGQGTLAMTRMVSAATDRSFGVAATLAVVY